jgi:hypothetical protein
MNAIELYQSTTGETQIEVRFEQETVTYIVLCTSDILQSIIVSNFVLI